MQKQIKQPEQQYQKVVKAVRKAELRRQATKREDQRLLNNLRHGIVDYL
jgi:hypothetical protein